MLSQLKIGIIIGLVIAYIIVRLARFNSRKSPEKNEAIKYYVDDTTKVYLVIAAGIILLIVFCLF